VELEEKVEAVEGNVKDVEDVDEGPVEDLPLDEPLEEREDLDAIAAMAALTLDPGSFVESPEVSPPSPTVAPPTAPASAPGITLTQAGRGCKTRCLGFEF